jgi:hypothetical protein
LIPANEILLAVAAAGGLTGAFTAHRWRTRNAVTALGAVVVYEIPKSTVVALEGSHPAVFDAVREAACGDIAPPTPDTQTPQPLGGASEPLAARVVKDIRQFFSNRYS